MDDRFRIVTCCMSPKSDYYHICCIHGRLGPSPMLIERVTK